MLKEITKRDGSIVEFDPNKINLAIKKAFVAARGESDDELIGKLTKAVVRYLKANVPEDTAKITIEDVQDAVEHVLIKYNLPKVAKEYILYRDFHNKIRTNKNILLDSYKLVGEYVDKVDWRVNENANAGYSYASMLNHISGSVVANYTLANMYPERIAKAHIDGDFHIHDLSAGIIPYCMGHSLKDLLMMGFIGVSGRASSKPAKHLDAALQQISNFMATLQTEAAGAQAFSSWDTYLAPFVHYDKLSYNQVKQMVQQFIFGLNIASRWGQCCKAQCKILSKHKGWVNYENLEIGDEIYVFDPKTEALKFDTVTHITVEPFKGHLHKYTNDQIEFSGSVTPKHRMVYRTGINGWRIKESKDIIPAKRIKIPVSATLYDADIEEIFKDEFLQLLVCVLTEGCIQQPPNKAPMIDIYKSPTRWGGDFIKELLTKLGIEFTVREEVNKEWNSVCERIHLKDCPEVWDVLHHLNYTKKAIPAFLTELNVRQSELIIKLWAKLDGYVITDNKETGSYKCRIQCDNDTIRGSLAEIAIRAGMSCRWVDSHISKNKTSTKHLVIYNAVEREVTGDEDTEEYDGIVWCPTTNTGTIIVKDCDSGHVFITGNSPFTNITMDLVPPHDLKDMPVIIGGELQDTTYGEYQKEMDMLNMAFIETMLEGDAEGKVFTFPIPTYNIVKDFNWDSEVSHKLFELTCKYGSPYFANFLSSDMDVSDSRSMCPMDGNTKVIVKDNDDNFKVCTIADVYDAYINGNHELQTITPDGWKKAIPNRIEPTDVYHITLSNMIEVILGENHLQPVIVENGKTLTLKAKDLKEGMYIPCNEYDCNNELFLKEFNHLVNHKITKVERKANSNYLYCFEVDNDSHTFYLANGMLTHNCRLRLDIKELRRKNGGLFGSGEKTGAVGVVTINMPRLGYLSKTKEEFFSKLEYLMILAKDSLEIKRKIAQRNIDNGLLPYTKIYITSLKNHFSTIGLVGMNEACLNLLGVDITTPEGNAFAVETMKFMRAKLSEFQEESDNLFNLEGSPAEGTSYRLAKIDKKKFSDIITAGTDENPYYTNSTQIPVGYTDDIFEACDLQNEVQSLYTGGTVEHLYLGERLEDPAQAAKLIKTLCTNYKIPYFSITPTFSICKVHGYIPGNHSECPYDKGPIERPAK